MLGGVFQKGISDLVDGSCSIVFRTQELTNDAFGKIRNCRNQIGVLSFVLEGDNDVIDLDTEEKKSAEDKFKEAIKNLWRVETSCGGDWNLYYISSLEKMTDILKKQYHKIISQ